MRISLSVVAGIIFMISKLSLAQQGYRLQVVAYTTPAPATHFEALPLPVRQICDSLPTGERFHLYVIDDLLTSAEAEKARRLAVAHGFAEAVVTPVTTGPDIPQIPIRHVNSAVTSGPDPNGYTVQVAAFSAPVPQRYFAGLGQPIRQVTGTLPTGQPYYLYVIDGFATYAEADKIRKMAIGSGFTETIAVKTANSRKPAMRVYPYKGTAGGDLVPEAAKLPENQAVPSEISGKI